MRKLFVGLGALVVPAVIAGFAATGCDEATKASEEICGACGTVATGDVGISGNAKLDGFFKAVADLNNANATINADFYTNVADLETAFGLEASGDIGTRVNALVAAIKGQVSANVDGGMKISYTPPQCSANLSVSVDAQAKCEVKGGCEAKVDPGSVSVTCEGSCTGSCSGGCSADLSCKLPSASVACSGSCEGKCELDSTAECSGTCDGACDGTCSVATDSDGNCHGTCSGKCTGTCTVEAQGSCSGKCSGSCTATVDTEASCTGEVKCGGECTGSCSGGCQGKATPPSASASCDASADCQAQASAQASANVECTPPALTVGFAFNTSATAEAQAKFKAQVEVLKVKGAAILQGFAKYQALVTGKVDGEVVFETTPVASIQASLEGVISAGVDGDLFADIPSGRIACVIPAMEASVSTLKSFATDASATLTAQTSFATAFTGGFQ